VFDVRTQGSCVQRPTQGSRVWRLNQGFLGSAVTANPRLLSLIFKKSPKLLGLALERYQLKLGSDKFNIIINIKNMIIFIRNILIFIVMNINNVIINKFLKNIEK